MCTHTHMYSLLKGYPINTWAQSTNLTYHNIDRYNTLLVIHFFQQIFITSSYKPYIILGNTVTKSKTIKDIYAYGA